MAEGNQKKAERRQARAARGTKAERRQARAAEKTKADERQAKSGKGTKQKKARAGGKGDRGAAAVPAGPSEEAPLEERIEWRLARIEEAVARQSERSEELLERLNELLEPAAEDGGVTDTD